MLALLARTSSYSYQYPYNRDCPSCLASANLNGELLLNAGGMGAHFVALLVMVASITPAPPTRPRASAGAAAVVEGVEAAEHDLADIRADTQLKRAGARRTFSSATMTVAIQIMMGIGPVK